MNITPNKYMQPSFYSPISATVHAVMLNKKHWRSSNVHEEG